MRILLIFLVGYTFTLGTVSSQVNSRRYYNDRPVYKVRQSPSDGVEFHRKPQRYRVRSLKRTYKYKTRIPLPQEKVAQQRIQTQLKAQHFREQQILREQQRQQNLEFGRRLALKQAKLDSGRPIRQSQAIRNYVKNTSVAVNNALLKRRKKEYEFKRQSKYRQSILHPKPAHIRPEFRLR